MDKTSQDDQMGIRSAVFGEEYSLSR